MSGAPRFRVVVGTESSLFEAKVNVLLEEGYEPVFWAEDRDGYYAYMLKPKGGDAA